MKTYYIPSGAIEPTLQIHDVLLVNEIEYRLFRPKRGDIVVFRPPIRSDALFIKRVIGAPGDQSHVHAGKVYRNELALQERYIAQEPSYELDIKN